MGKSVTDQCVINMNTLNSTQERINESQFPSTAAIANQNDWPVSAMW